MPPAAPASQFPAVIGKSLTSVTALLVLAGAAAAQQSGSSEALSVSPGELVIDPPTLINLGFEWLIRGDANRNASVAVSYRKVGESEWRAGMPLLRLHHERVEQADVFDLVLPNMFAGSILDLEPGTAYEVRLAMSDPDGVERSGASTRTVTVSTRPEPVPAEGGNVYHVYPVGWEGPREEPSFTGLMCAYNYRCGAGDTAPGGRPRVKPGDIILMHAGTYAYRYELYANQTTINATTTFEGTYYLLADGTPERPIVIKAAGDGEVIIDGRGNFNLFNVKAADYNYFEGITFRNTDIAIWAGTQLIVGSKGLTVKNCRFEQVGMGVFTNYSGSSDFYIADNVFLGRNDPNHLTGWNGQFWEQFAGVDGQVFPPIMASYNAVRVYGPGHVIAYNYVADFHDGIDTDFYGMPDGSHAHEGPSYPPREYWDRRPVSIDIYNNYITNAHDNSIEMDGSMHNIRVMRNVLVNSASHPMSTQPSVGGPIYFIRNIVYHAPGGSTRASANSPGVIFYHNTVTSETTPGSTSNSHWRNNLMLGQSTTAAVFTVNTSTNYSSSDYNGFRPNPGQTPAFQWNSPSSPSIRAGTVALQGTGAPGVERRGYATLEEYQNATGQDRNSVLVDYDVFVNVPKLDRDPSRVQRLYRFEDHDFRLRPGSAAVDRGVPLPNVNDGFTGSAPDLGALESGQPMPIYGPRPRS